MGGPYQYKVLGEASVKGVGGGGGLGRRQSWQCFSTRRVNWVSPSVESIEVLIDQD